MVAQRVRVTGKVLFLVATLLFSALLNTLVAITPAQALSYPTVGQTSQRGITSITTSSISVLANELYLVACGASDSVTLTTSASGVGSGTTPILNQAGTPSLLTAKVAILGSGTSGFTCSASSSTTLVMWVYRLDGFGSQTVSASSTGSSTTVSTGTANAASISPGRVGFVVGVANGGVSSGGSWSAGAGGPWTYNGEVASSGGPPSGRTTLFVGSGTAAAGNNSGTITISSSNPWRGQIVVLEAIPSAHIQSLVVNSSNVPISSPSFAMTASTTSFSCQTTTGTLGNSNARIRAAVGSDYNFGWTLSLGATGGTSATWSNGSGSTYAYNNPAGSGCTAGQLTVSGASATYQHACIGAGIGVSTFSGVDSYSNGSVDAITLISAGVAANLGCYRYAYGYTLTQNIPPEKRSGTYTLGLTLTMTAL